MPAVESTNQSPTQTTTPPCRTCTDFKSWAKQQREIMGINLNRRSDQNFTSNIVMGDNQKENTGKLDVNKECPLDKDELGKSTWGLLHTIAANYPEKPTTQQVSDMSTFFNILSKYYPCEFCAKDLRKEIKEEPIIATSQETFSQWLCRLHNKVNIKIGKPIFDCSKVNERWRDGWKDGSCDM